MKETKKIKILKKKDLELIVAKSADELGRVARWWQKLPSIVTAWPWRRNEKST